MFSEIISKRVRTNAVNRYNNSANLVRRLPASLFTLRLSMVESLLLRRQKLDSIFTIFRQFTAYKVCDEVIQSYLTNQTFQFQFRINKFTNQL